MYSQNLVVPLNVHILMHLLWFPNGEDFNVPGTTVFDQNDLFRSV